MPRKSRGSLPTARQAPVYISLAEVAESVGLSPREVARHACERKLPLFVVGQGWPVAWNAVAAAGEVADQAELTSEWRGTGQVAHLQPDTEFERETLVVLELIDDTRRRAALGTLVARSEAAPERWEPRGRTVPIGDLQMRQSEAERLRGELTDQEDAMNYRRRYQAALRLLAVVLARDSALRRHPPTAVNVVAPPERPKGQALKFRNATKLAEDIGAFMKASRMAQRGMLPENIRYYLAEAAAEFERVDRES